MTPLTQITYNHWRNDVYFCYFEPYHKSGIMRLTVRRHDYKPVTSWDDLQEIKNQIAGPDAVAIEIYPRSKYLVNSVNFRHLFVLPDSFVLPVNLFDERVDA